jgi:hypothetical protein
MMIIMIKITKIVKIFNIFNLILQVKLRQMLINNKLSINQKLCIIKHLNHPLQKPHKFKNLTITQKVQHHLL